MHKFIALTDEQWERYKKGEAITIKRERMLWRPQGGEYHLVGPGLIEKSPSTPSYREFGLEYPTEDFARRAHILMRPIHRYVAYALEYWPDYEVPPIGQATFSVYYDDSVEQWVVRGNVVTRDPWIPYGPEDKVRELALRLNSGEVRF